MSQRIRTFHLTLSELLYRVLRKSSGYPTQGSTAQNASRRSAWAIGTIEALAQNGKLHPVQQAWLDLDVPQCGYCQSGIIMTVVALLKEKPFPPTVPTGTWHERVAGRRLGATHPRRPIVSGQQRTSAAGTSWFSNHINSRESVPFTREEVRRF